MASGTLADNDEIIIEGVPVFDAHEDPSAPTAFQRVDGKLLQEIAANSQRRIDDTGDECPIVIGHTGKEGQQNPIVGYASNFRVSKFGRVNPRDCIVCDWRIQKKHADTVRANPRRSIELWPKDKIIDPISILGAETPKRDLGLLVFSRPTTESEEVTKYSKRHGGRPLRYSVDESAMDGDSSMPYQEESDVDVDENALVQKVVDALMATPQMQWVTDRINEEGDDEAEELNDDGTEADDTVDAGDAGDTESGGETGGDDIGGDEPPPVEEPPIDAGDDAGGDEMPPAPSDEDDENKPKYSRNGSPAKPAPKKPAKPVAAADQYARTRNQQTELENKRLADRVAALEAERDEERKQKIRFSREQQLTHLQSLGVELDRAEVLELTEEMSDDGFERFAQNIQKYHRRTDRPPVGMRVVTSPTDYIVGDERSNGPSMSKDDIEEVHRYMRDESVSYEVALNQVRAEKAKPVAKKPSKR